MPSSHFFLCCPFPPVFNISKHQSLFQQVSSSYQVAKALELQLQHQYFQWIFRTDFLWRDSQDSSPNNSSKESIVRHSAFFTVQLSHPYMTTGKTIVLTRWTFVGKIVMSLLFNMLSRLAIAFLPRSKYLLISWLQSPSAVIWGPKRWRKRFY